MTETKPHHGLWFVGRVRHYYYGVCECGKTTTNSLHVEDIQEKIEAHKNGDNKGMV